MGYKALYRKYRPNFFEDVLGQDSIIKTLKNSIIKDEIGHAYLFSGTRGTGKTTVAKIFAKAVNCLKPKNGLPCGECDICKCENTDEIQDIIEIDAASNNGVDEIRDLKNKINLSPTCYKYKVYIIDEVHMLSTGAFNALLKTLEEPPKHAIFILATTEPQKLPITILSRCQKFDFKKLSIEKIEERLKYISEKEKIKIDNDCLEEISKICDGSMRDSIGLLEQVASYTNKKISMDDIYEISGNISNLQIGNLLKLIINGKTKEIIDFFDDINSTGKSFEKLSENLILFLRNILVCKKIPNYFEDKNNINKNIIKEISKDISEKLLFDLIKELNILTFEIKKTSHPSILFEMFLFKVISDEKPIIAIEEKEKPSKLEQKKEKVEDEEIISSNIVLEVSEKKTRELSEYKKALINNTVALAEKENLKCMQENWKKLQTYLINKKFKEAATILLDSKLISVSGDHILLTYKYDSMVDLHDKENDKINLLISEIAAKNHIVVAISDEYWKELRPIYVELKKKNTLIKIMEEKEIKQLKKEETHDNASNLINRAIDVFGEELIEMEE